MSRVSLPSIGNNGQGTFYDEHKSAVMFDVEPIVEEEEYNHNKFSDTVQRLANQPFPEISGEQSMKNRISTLERTAEVQGDFNKLSHRSFINLSGDLISTEEALKDLINQVQNTFDNKLNNMKKEYDHRFELQANENKRLQNHVATLKADSHMLKKKLQATVDRLKKLQMEFGDGDLDLEEDLSILSVSGTATLSRPNTTSMTGNL